MAILTFGMTLFKPLGWHVWLLGMTILSFGMLNFWWWYFWLWDFFLSGWNFFFEGTHIVFIWHLRGHVCYDVTIVSHTPVLFVDKRRQMKLHMYVDFGSHLWLSSRHNTSLQLTYCLALHINWYTIPTLIIASTVIVLVSILSGWLLYSKLSLLITFNRHGNKSATKLKLEGIWRPPRYDSAIHHLESQTRLVTRAHNLGRCHCYWPELHEL